MTARGWWLAAGVGLAALGVAAPGCSQKPREIKQAKEVKSGEGEATVELPKGPAPTQSDSAAAKVVADAIAAHTGGRPELLGKLRTVEVERSGSDISPQNQPVPLTWRIRAVWPDRYRVDASISGASRLTICRVGDAAWMAGDLTSGRKEQVTAAQSLKGIMADDSYEWMLMLAPLAEPGLVVTPAADAKIGGRDAAGVLLSSKTMPKVVAHFDKETKLLVQFTYEGSEAGGDVVKEVRVHGTREFNGVKLPSKIAINWKGRPAVEWTVNKVEFPVDLPPKVFEEP